MLRCRNAAGGHGAVSADKGDGLLMQLMAIGAHRIRLGIVVVHGRRIGCGSSGGPRQFIVAASAQNLYLLRRVAMSPAFTMFLPFRFLLLDEFRMD